jgi:hypothetical protein
MSYSLAPETIKKRASFTTCTIYFDDVKSDKFLSTITEGYDDGEVYETKEVNISKTTFVNNFNYFLYGGGGDLLNVIYVNPNPHNKNA